MSTRYRLPGFHEPEDHRQTLFGNLGDRYGTEAQQRQIELFFSVALDACDDCAQRLVWKMARDADLIKAMAQTAMLSVAIAHGKLDVLLSEADASAHTDMMSVIDEANTTDRAEIIISLANTYVFEQGDIDHGPDCEGCNERGQRWDHIEQHRRS